MKKAEVVIGSHYLVKVSGKLAPVKVLRVGSYGGWDAINVTTGRTVFIKSAAKLRCLLLFNPASGKWQAVRPE